MAKIAIIDDDLAFCRTLCASLEREGYDTLAAHDGAQGLELARSANPDLLLIAARLPGLDGFSICRLMRFESDIPIILLAAREGESDRILGLDLGADDYVNKPFFIGELLARIRALLRRAHRATPPPEREALTLGDLHVDVGRRRVFQGELSIALVPKEFDLLVCLMRNSGMVLSRAALLQNVWGDDFKHDPRTVDVHIRWLRAKIEPDPPRPTYIQTVRGRGYRFAEGVRTQIASATELQHHDQLE